MTDFNQHIPTIKTRQRISDLVASGIPLHIIAQIVELDDQTIKKHYKRELDCAQAEVVDRIGKVVALQAEAGDAKSQALYLKTQGARFGWIEKQIVENVSSKESDDLKAKIAELEATSQRDY